MAGRLLQHGFPVFSCANRRREAIEVLGKDGLIEVQGPAEVGARVDVLMTMVMDQAQTDQILRGPNGALATLKPGSVIILMSTLGPGYCQVLAVEAAEHGIDLLDCPVSGMRPGAFEGTLAIMAGGDIAVIERCREALETMGSIFHCGDIGMGMVAKLANNGVAMGTAALLIEVRAMARAYGMDLNLLMEILKKSTANSYIAQNWDALHPILPHVFNVGVKDVGLCAAAADSKGSGSTMFRAWQSVDWASMKPGEF